MAERLVVDQALCDKVKKLMSRGIDTKDIVEILGISQSTVSRIQTADFDVEKYREMNENRRKAERLKSISHIAHLATSRPPT